MTSPVRVLRPVLSPPEPPDVELAPRIPGPRELERLRELALRANTARIRPAAAKEEAAARFWRDRGAWYQTAALAEVPRSLWNLALDCLDTPATAAVDAFFNEGPGDGEDEYEYGRCLGLLGDVGTGKTVAAAKAFWWDGSDTPLFTTFPAMLRRLLDPTERKATGARLREASFLCIDDFGSGAAFKEGSFLEGLVEELFVERELARAWTCITSNLPEPALLDFCGDRVADRLLGPWGRLVEVGGENLRRRRARP